MKASAAVQNCSSSWQIFQFVMCVCVCVCVCQSVKNVSHKQQLQYADSVL
jgi:hypothetical protein